MIKEFRLPELGENITSGEVVQVLVSPGEVIKKDQPVLEIETDKATIEVPATEAGTVKEVMVKPGDTAQVGQIILTVDSISQQRGEEKAEALPQVKAKPAAMALEETGANFSTPGMATASVAAAQIEVAQPMSSPTTESKVREFRLPELGENIQSGEVVQVHVKPGDTIRKDQVVLELETDKATIEVPSPFAGKIKDILVKPGDTAEVGQLILTLETTTAPQATPEAAGAGREAAATPEAAQPAPPAAGPPAREAAPQIAGEPSFPLPPATPSAPAPKKLIPASPAVRRFAREIGINIARVPGTGPGGRISIEDVKRYARDLHTRPAAAPAVVAAAQPLPLPDFSKWGQVQREPMSNIRRSTANRMAYAWNTVPHVTQFDKADITELEKLRKNFSPKAEAAGGKLTLTAILLKITASALRVFPKFNASLDPEKNEIIYKNYYHIGVAVDTDRGLLVPVIRDVNQKNIVELAVELSRVAERARNRKLSLEEMQGGTFTITNLGGIGGTNFAPIVNWPEVAILGVARGSYEPVYIDGQFQPRLRLPLSVSYDHRVIDGADAARFLRWIVNALEQPFMIALEG